MVIRTEYRKTTSFDDMVDALATIPRRNLLVALVEHNPQDDGPVVIADSESESETVNRLISMQHVHVPKLVHYGVIEWNKETHEVVKGSNFDEMRPFLDLLDTHVDELPSDWL